MNVAMVLFEMCIASICLLSKPSWAAYVSDLNPSLDCPAVLIQKVSERMQNPDLVRNNEFIRV